MGGDWRRRGDRQRRERKREVNGWVKEGGREGREGGKQHTAYLLCVFLLFPLPPSLPPSLRLLAVLSLCIDGASLPREVFVELAGFLTTQFD